MDRLARLLDCMPMFHAHKYPSCRQAQVGAERSVPTNALHEAVKGWLLGLADFGGADQDWLPGKGQLDRALGVETQHHPGLQPHLQKPLS